MMSCLEGDIKKIMHQTFVSTASHLEECSGDNGFFIHHSPAKSSALHGPAESQPCSFH